jgi:hypothetical protein
MVQLVEFCGKVKRSNVWNWATVIHGNGLVPSNYNKTRMAQVLDSTFCLFLYTVGKKICTAFVSATSWGKRLAEATSDGPGGRAKIPHSLRLSK